MAALICDICGGKLKVGSELSNKIDALKREVSILSHKILGRKSIGRSSN